MCLSDSTTKRIIEAINTADRSIYFAILAFTRLDIAEAMRSKWGGRAAAS